MLLDELFQFDDEFLDAAQDDGFDHFHSPIRRKLRYKLSTSGGRRLRARSSGAVENSLDFQDR